MKVDYNRNLLTKLAGVVGATGASLLMSLSAGANEVLNPNPSIFAEAPYNRGQRVLVNAENTATESEPELVKKDKKTTPPKGTVSQGSGGRGANPRPSILQECPYNRAACTNQPGSGSGASPRPSTTIPPTTPEATPTTPSAPTPVQVPSTNTPPAPGTTPPGGSGSTQNKNLVALAEADGSFTTLTKALKAAGLTATLQGKDNYTIFAPTDAAFAKLPQDALRDLLKPENKEVLLKLLTYHVVKGQVLSTDLKSGEVKSVEGGAIKIQVDPATGVTVNDAKVTKADIRGSNGVIHAIDQVILPPDL